MTEFSLVSDGVLWPGPTASSVVDRACRDRRRCGCVVRARERSRPSARWVWLDGTPDLADGRWPYLRQLDGDAELGSQRGRCALACLPSA